MDPALLLLADGRLPTGAHAHSAGLEAAVRHALVADVADLQAWMVGCLHTTWRAEAAAAVLAARLAVGDDGAPSAPSVPGAWRRLDREVEARIPSAHGRAVSRTLGRQLLRTGRAVWPHPALDLAAGVHPDGPGQPLALGAVVAAAGHGPEQAAAIALHHAVQGAATAAIRLLGLDPYAVARTTAGLGGAIAGVAVDLADLEDDPARLPLAGAPTVDVMFTRHATADGRLFAS